MFFFFNDTATTEIYTLSLHDALPIYGIFGTHLHHFRLTACQRAGLVEHQRIELLGPFERFGVLDEDAGMRGAADADHRSEEHTSELQSRQYLVCRLLLEKKNKALITN